MSFADIQPVVTPPGGGGTTGAVVPFKLFDIQNVKANGIVENRDALVYDATTGNWINESLQARLPHWNNVAQYNVGDLVLYHGKIYRCTLNGAGQEPESAGHLAAWANLSMAIKEWAPGQDWERGDIVSVGWNPAYFAGQPIHTAILGAKLSSIWIATKKIEGSIPVVAGEPDSVSNVPPGQWRATNYVQHADGTWDNPGPHIGSAAWVSLTQPSFVAVNTYRDLLDMNVPVVPGSKAFILSGKNAGLIYEYTAVVGSVGDNLVTRGWSNPIHCDLWPTFVAVPPSRLSPGVAGQMSSDANYVYFCISDGVWNRVARDTTGGW